MHAHYYIKPSLANIYSSMGIPYGTSDLFVRSDLIVMAYSFTIMTLCHHNSGKVSCMYVRYIPHTALDCDDIMSLPAAQFIQ